MLWKVEVGSTPLRCGTVPVNRGGVDGSQVPLNYTYEDLGQMLEILKHLPRKQCDACLLGAGLGDDACQCC